MEKLFGKWPEEVQCSSEESSKVLNENQDLHILEKLDPELKKRFNHIESVVRSPDHGSMVWESKHNSVMNATISSREHTSVLGEKMIITLTDKTDPAHEDLIQISIDIDKDGKHDDFIIKIENFQWEPMFSVERGCMNPWESIPHFHKVEDVELYKFLTAVEKHLNII
jgi:hypothetical protein